MPVGIAVPDLLLFGVLYGVLPLASATLVFRDASHREDVQPAPWTVAVLLGFLLYVLPGFVVLFAYVVLVTTGGD